MIPESFKTSRQSAVRDYHTFQFNHHLLRVLVEILAATNASDLIHESYVEYQETFSKIQLHQLNRRHRFKKGWCREEIPFLHSTALSSEARRNLSRKREGRANQ